MMVESKKKTSGGKRNLRNVPETVNLFGKESGSDRDFVNQNFAVSDTDEDDLDIVGHPVMTNSIVCALCIEGEATVCINFETYHLSRGSFIILAPKTMFLCEEGDYSENFLADYISFSLDFVRDIRLSHIIYDIKKTLYLVLDEKEIAWVIKIYESLKERYRSTDHPYRREVSQYMLLTAIYDFSIIYEKYLPESNDVKPNSHSDKFFDLLFRYYRKYRQVGFYADKLGLTPKYLSKIIKNETGRSVQDWIFQLIIFEAKSLLRSTQMNVAEMADYFNYPDATSFGKFFKKQVEQTPSAYRKDVQF